MFRKILLTGLFCIAAAPAYAHDWYLIHPSAAQCVNSITFGQQMGEPTWTSPASVMAAQQSLGNIVFVQEFRDSGGNLAAVELTIKSSDGGTKGYLDFYTSFAGCEAALARDEANGTVAPPNDMN